MKISATGELYFCLAKNGVFWLALLTVFVVILGCEARSSLGPVSTAGEDASLEIPIASEGVEGVRGLVTPRDLITLREIGAMVGSGLSVSPDGDHIAFELHQADPENNDYRVAWFAAVAKPGGHAINVGDGGDPTLFRNSSGAWISEYPKWSPDSRGIAYRKRVNGETQIWWSTRDGQEHNQLTYSPADVEAFHWSKDGERLYFTTDADRQELQEMKRLRSRTGHLFDYTSDWVTIDASPKYKPYSLTPNGQARVWVLHLKNKVERLASDAELAEYQGLVQSVHQLPSQPLARRVTHNADSSSVAWLVPAHADKQGRNPPMTLYASTSPDGSDPIRCPAIECTGLFGTYRPLSNGLKWNDFQDEILFVRYEAASYGKRTLYGWTVGQSEVREVLTTDEWISDCSIVEGYAICFRETPTTPRTVVSIDLADGSITTMVDPNPEFKGFVLGDVEFFEWTNSLGHATFGYLVKPPDSVQGRRYPLVFVGYRARMALRGGVGEEYPVHALAANGFAVLVYDRPENHGAYAIHADSLELAKADWGPDNFDYRMPLASFQSAIRILSNRGLVDATRVGVTGLSNGVGHVNYSIINTDVFSAAITSSSNFGPSGYFLSGAWNQDTKRFRRQLGTGRHGTADGFRRQLTSLTLNAERVTTPLLVNSPDTEYLPALEEVTALIENDRPVELHVYPDEGHIKWQPAHRLSIYERNIDWFNFWLQDIEDPALHKAPQYERWRKLRQLQMALGSKSAPPSSAATK